MSTYIKGYNGETKWMHLLIEDDELLILWFLGKRQHWN